MIVVYQFINKVAKDIQKWFKHEFEDKQFQVKDFPSWPNASK